MVKGHVWREDLIRTIYEIELKLTHLFNGATSVVY